MKIILLLLVSFLCSVSFCGEALAFRILHYGNSNGLFLVEFFHMNFLLSNFQSLGEKFNQGFSFAIDGPKGYFFFKKEKITWTCKSYLIQKGNFSIEQKNSEQEIKFSGDLVNVDENQCDIILNYTSLFPVKTEYGMGQDIFSVSGNFSPKFGMIQLLEAKK
jgi:hypothetical protein